MELIERMSLSNEELEKIRNSPEKPSDWPLPSFDARDWAKSWCEIAEKQGFKTDEDWMIGWFANALMRGYDEHTKRSSKEILTLKSRLERAEVECGAYRKALNEIANMDMTRSDRSTPYHIAICALQKPLPLAALTKVEKEEG